MNFTWKSVKTATSGDITYQLQVSWLTDFDPDYSWSADYYDSTLGNGAIVSYESTPDQVIWSIQPTIGGARCGDQGCSLWTSTRELLGMPATPTILEKTRSITPLSMPSIGQTPIQRGRQV